MKRSRPLSLFLIVLILIFCFSVSVSASDDENLINPNLTEWINYYPDYTTIGATSYPGLFYIKSDVNKVQAGVSHVKGSYVYDLANKLSAGSSYTFSFHLLSLEEVNEIYPSITEQHIYGGMLNGYGRYTIALASYNSESQTFEPVENCYLVINHNNYLDYFGTDISLTFELPNVVNPCILISYTEASISTVPTLTYIRDISLLDNDVANDDGFLSKLFVWFQEKFEAIGLSFDNLGIKLTDLKDSFIGKITELKDNFATVISNLGASIGSFFDEQLEGIEEFFTGFGNLILYFDWEGDYTNPFDNDDSPLDKVSAFFDDLIDYIDGIGTSIENVLDSITGGLHIFDEFTSRFPWLKGIAVFCLALIVITRFIGL